MPSIATPLPGFGPDPERQPELQTELQPELQPERQPEQPPFEVRVVRSARRKRTVGAQLVGDVLTVTVPNWMNPGEIDGWTAKMTASFRRKQSADRIDLRSRAARLAARYRLPRPHDIRWADDMTTRWGSCTVSTGHIRISTRLAGFPDWVVDYVIVHELAHLEVPGHGDDFWQLAHRYPKAERAIGYLIAKAGDTDPHD